MNLVHVSVSVDRKSSRVSMRSKPLQDCTILDTALGNQVVGLGLNMGISTGFPRSRSPHCDRTDSGTLLRPSCRNILRWKRQFRAPTSTNRTNRCRQRKREYCRRNRALETRSRFRRATTGASLRHLAPAYLALGNDPTCRRPESLHAECESRAF